MFCLAEPSKLDPSAAVNLYFYCDVPEKGLAKVMFNDIGNAQN